MIRGRRRSSRPAVFLLAACLGGSAARGSGPVPSCRTASADLERVIAGRARSLAMEEHCQFRIYDTLDDVDGDGKDDFIAVFTVEGPGGGNDHVSFLALFRSTSPGEPIVVEAGRRGVRDPEAVSARRGEITLETKEYLPGDAMCCPSGRGKRVWRLAGGALRAAGGR